MLNGFPAEVQPGKENLLMICKLMQKAAKKRKMSKN